MYGILCKVVHAVAALGAIYVGLIAMGRDFLATGVLAPYANIVMYLFGVAGVLSLVMLVICARCEKHGSCQ